MTFNNIIHTFNNIILYLFHTSVYKMPSKTLQYQGTLSVPGPIDKFCHEFVQSILLICIQGIYNKRIVHQLVYCSAIRILFGNWYTVRQSVYCSAINSNNFHIEYLVIPVLRITH